MDISFVTGLALGAATVVAITMVASVTLLPALLGFAGSRVEVTRWRGLIAAALVALGLVAVGLKAPGLVTLALVALRVLVVISSFFVSRLRVEVPMRSARAPEQTLSYRWSRAVQHHPVRALLLGVAFLGVLALPVLSVRPSARRAAVVGVATALSAHCHDHTLLGYGRPVPGYDMNRDELLGRLRRIEGQVRGIAQMVERDRYCIDVLTQISAVTKGLQSVAVGMFDDHLRHCGRRRGGQGRP